MEIYTQMLKLKFIPIALLLLSFLTACGPTQADLDAANARATQAEQVAAVQAQRADEANQRANEYWLAAKWNAATQPERIGLVVMGIGAMGAAMLMVYLAHVSLMDAPGRRQHELDLRDRRIREQELRNEERKLAILAMRQAQLEQQAVHQIKVQKYAAPQLPAGQRQLQRHE